MWPDYDDRTPAAQTYRVLCRIESVLLSIDKSVNNIATILGVAAGWGVVYFIASEHGWPWQQSWWPW